MSALALALLFEASLPPPRDWMAVRNGAVELALAHRETDHLDGGILTVDPRRRVVIWEGIDGDLGCPAKVYGSAWEARPAEIAESPADFEGEAVRVRGRFEAAAGNAPARLVDESGAAVFVTADPDIARLVAVEAKRWPGQTLEVTGVVRRDTTAPTPAPRYTVSFWDFDASAVPAAPAISADAMTLKLPELLANADGAKGRLVRVVGQFRGRNLYGDLPAPSFRHRLDWCSRTTARRCG